MYLYTYPQQQETCISHQTNTCKHKREGAVKVRNIRAINPSDINKLYRLIPTEEKADENTIQDKPGTDKKKKCATGFLFTIDAMLVFRSGDRVGEPTFSTFCRDKESGNFISPPQL